MEHRLAGCEAAATIEGRVSIGSGEVRIKKPRAARKALSWDMDSPLFVDGSAQRGNYPEEQLGSIAAYQIDSEGIPRYLKMRAPLSMRQIAGIAQRRSVADSLMARAGLWWSLAA